MATNDPLSPKSNVSKPSIGRKRSVVWDYFTKIRTEDKSKPRASCNLCGMTYACDPNINSTKSMLGHLEKTCKKSPLRKVDRNQSILGFQSGSSSRGLVPISFSVEACREVLAEMLVIDELPFKHVEGEGFKKFMLVLQPKWNVIPLRVTVAKDIYKLYLIEKDNPKNALKGQRICLTTYTWASV
ncbi:zinc finger BED domain-containing protein RICESLEEPER 3-like [Juglans microcarpa x Juglans regia]|uniref:zinc finger BED domain-containing protein RICESLEEPER 3-like n=1 Tax=Juglans microcarpa x Juglans regia TaxID=2249226 RepID=UPI001B7E1B81|nr:zinc finger BED domain-containing protein RICESLEEPER 3-like [Juglans microcarpa x Juglans regia]